MKHLKFYLFILLVILLAILFPIPVLSDAAPPAVPEGENINPGEGTTMVQMVAEEVIIDVSLTEDYFYSSNHEFAVGGHIVAYNCTFWLQNQGRETENLLVRFPIKDVGDLGKITILSIKVNDHPIPWVEDDLNTLPSDYYYWAHFEVTFPPGEEIELKVTYTTITRGSGIENLRYILETGAGWYGMIEQGRIILRLPYQASTENVVDIKSSPTEGIFNDSDLYWDFTDLEPAYQDNLSVDIIDPGLWVEILADRSRLEESPNNFSALYRLAENISYAVIRKMFDIRSATLFEEGLEAIRRATSLNPNDVNSHELYTWYLESAGGMENYLLILQEVEIILELDPENNTAEHSREWALNYLSGYQTATAGAKANSTSTYTHIPTATPIISTPTLTRAPEQETPSSQTSSHVNTPEVKEENLTSDAEQPMNPALILSIVILLMLGGIGIIRVINKEKE